MRNKSIFAIVAVFIAATLLVFASGAQAQTDTVESAAKEPRTISVNGNGVILIEPDIAYIKIGVHTEGENAEETVASNRPSVFSNVVRRSWPSYTLKVSP